MTWRAGLATLAFVPAVLFGACDNESAGSNDGDCSARIRYAGIVYRPHNELNEAAPQGAELGSGDVIDCGDVSSAPKVASATILSVKGVAPTVAVIVARGDYRGIYVAEGLSKSDWPSVLRREN